MKVESVRTYPKHYEVADREAIIAMLGAAPSKRRIWEWQFEQNPFGKVFDPVVITDGERLVGFNGVMPITVKYGAQNVNALWSCDFYVDSAYRGQGLGKQIKKLLIEKSPLIMSFGVSRQAAFVLQRMGWKKSESVCGYRLQRRIDSFKTAGLAVLQLINRGWGILQPSVYQGRIELVSSLPAAEVVDDLWHKVSPDYTKIVHRTFAYLDWKYQKHPIASYQFVIARNAEGVVDGIMVIRQHETSIRIVDFLGPVNAFAMKRALVRHCKLRFLHATSFMSTTTDCQLGTALRCEGFYRTRTRPSFFIRSSLPGDTDCHLGWFLMTGDSDGELLLAAREVLGHQGHGDRS